MSKLKLSFVFLLICFFTPKYSIYQYKVPSEIFHCATYNELSACYAVKKQPRTKKGLVKLTVYFKNKTLLSLFLNCQRDLTCVLLGKCVLWLHLVADYTSSGVFILRTRNVRFCFVLTFIF